MNDDWLHRDFTEEEWGDVQEKFLDALIKLVAVLKDNIINDKSNILNGDDKNEN